MFQASNICKATSKSGKMVSKELQEYLSEIYHKNEPYEMMLLFSIHGQHIKMMIQ